ncbi:hypothetical protein DyAD56_22225 [Dyella sp. AD56]|nr:hypothetical protein DyAD56_22225 [Dyella sp. AD56]
MPARCMAAEKKAYPLRISAVVLEAMQRWADDDLRSVNAQIEFVLREALRKQGRLKRDTSAPVQDDEND